MWLSPKSEEKNRKDLMYEIIFCSPRDTMIKQIRYKTQQHSTLQK
jgi:hypothetical protein